MIWLLPGEIALLAFAGDVALYYEAVLITFMLGTQMRLREMVRAVARAPRNAWRGLRFATLAVRRRAARARRRLRAAWRSFSSGDEDGAMRWMRGGVAPQYA
jgi:hypothetical protein